jgi:replication factor A2
VTIKQLLEATQSHPEAPYQIDGADINVVFCIGQVRNISTQSTNITYKIDDGTGEIEAKQWIDSTRMDDDMDVDGQGAKQSTRKKIELDGYVKAFGTIKDFSNKRYLGAHSVRPLADINELHVHFLEATAVHLFFKHGPPPSKSEDGGYGAPAKGAADDYNAGGMGGRPLPPMSATARRVYNLLKNEPQSNEGLHMQNISAKLGLPTTEVIKAGDELSSASLIFSTMDEYTWAILEY